MTSKYAILNNTVVVNIATATPEFAQEQGWVLLTGNAGIGWSYINGVFTPPPPVDYSAQNKATATQLLQDTDWTATVDINDPVYSDPYLANQPAFLTYRSQVRQIAINPPTQQVTNWPILPQEEWLPGNPQIDETPLTE